MTATRLSLYNGALRELGERQLASLAENRAPRRYLDTAYNNDGVNKMLAMGQWKFAQRTVKMTADTGIAPAFGYQYGFTRPTDLVRTTRVCSDEFFNVPLEQYEQETGTFYASIDTFYLSYVSNDASFGGDLSKWPPGFVAFAELWLASQILGQVTGAKSDRDEFAKMLQRALVRAQATDAMEQPTKFPPMGNWSGSRMRGNASRWDRGSTTRLIG